MALEEMLRNSAPAIGGLLVVAAALACARFGRRARARPREAARSANRSAE